MNKEWNNGFIIGIILSVLFIIIISILYNYYPLWNPECNKDTAPDNTHITNIIDCEEGCIYAEWVIYGYQNLTKPMIYTKCAEVCSQGESILSSYKLEVNKSYNNQQNKPCEVSGNSSQT